MNNEEFLKGKAKYNELSRELQKTEDERASKLLEIKTKMKYLAEDEKVKEYISLQYEKNQMDIDRMLKPSIGERKAKIINEAFDDICKNTQDSNNIYVFMGYNGLYRYKNLETTKEECVELDKHWAFVKNNRIIFSNFPNTEFFFEITREKYLMFLSQFSQKTAVQKVLKLGKKPGTGR